LVHFLQLRSHFLAVGLPSYLEESVSRPIHVMGEAQKIECLRLHAMPFRIQTSKPSELDDPRFLFGQLETELFKPSLERFEYLVRLSARILA
jgi:hypothetical protein